MKKVEKVAKVSEGNTKTSDPQYKYKQCRNWCFTDFELLEFEKIYNEYKDIIRYICFGLETCPKTNKKHYQGWIQLINKKTMGGVKRIFKTKKIHLECCRGSEYDNEKYCKKDNDFKCFGKFVSRGQRTDLESIKKMIDNNEKMKKVANDYFGNYIRYYGGFTKYRELVLQEKTKEFRLLDVEYIWGNTGVGKTKYATTYDKDCYVINGYDLKWWDGYEGQKTLVIDEYNCDVNITHMLKILDGYQLRLPIKGGFTYANWDKVIITSNIDYNYLHLNAKKEHRDALKRRINFVKELKIDEKK